LSLQINPSIFTMVRTVTSTTLTLQTDFVDSPPPIYCGGILAGSSPRPARSFAGSPTRHLTSASPSIT
jgi:hypothetical protein